MLKKIFSFAVLLAILTLSFSSCITQYKDNISLEEIESKVEIAISSADFSDATENYISKIIGVDLDKIVEYSVKIPDGAPTLDEYGIFVCESDEVARDVAEKIDEYFKMRRDEWTGMYMQDQYPKLQNASCRVFGNYVVYLIAEKHIQQAAYNSIDDLLKK